MKLCKTSLIFSQPYIKNGYRTQVIAAEFKGIHRLQVFCKRVLRAECQLILTNDRFKCSINMFSDAMLPVYSHFGVRIGISWPQFSVLPQVSTFCFVMNICIKGKVNSIVRMTDNFVLYIVYDKCYCNVISKGYVFHFGSAIMEILPFCVFLLFGNVLQSGRL